MVVTQAKAVESNPDSVWALKPGGMVVIVEVSEGGVYVEPGGWDVDKSGAGKDVASEVENKVVGLRRS